MGDLILIGMMNVITNNNDDDNDKKKKKTYLLSVHIRI